MVSIRRKTMKKTKLLPVLITGTILLFAGCSTAPNINSTQGLSQTLEDAHPDRFEKTILGMGVDEFKTVWPEATRSGLSEEGEVYEFVYTHLLQDQGPFGTGNVYDYKIYTKFYFIDNKLIKYESTKGW
jgi:hypothetical protein